MCIWLEIAQINIESAEINVLLLLPSHFQPSFTPSQRTSIGLHGQVIPPGCLFSANLAKSQAFQARHLSQGGVA